MKDYETIIRITKDCKETINEANIHEEYKQDSLVYKVAELEYAKNGVEFCLQHANGSVDMRGLEYWASRVEKLRNEIKELI